MPSGMLLSLPCTMYLTHMLHPVGLGDDPLHIVWNLDDSQLGGISVGRPPEFFHDLHEFFVIAWNERASAIQTWLLWCRRKRPIRASVGLL
jgi:hypothetical protein